MDFQIHHRYTNEPAFECELPADFEDKPYSDQLGEAVKIALTAHANLFGANLTGANLSGANLPHANLFGADLSGANLSCTNLLRANLTGANLLHANLFGANLSCTNLFGADLSGADLSGANLLRANLLRANLFGANLTGATWRGIKITRAPLQLDGLDYRVTFLESHMQIGCEFHSLADWAAFDDRRIAEMDGKRALTFWHKHRDALLLLAKSNGQ